MVKDPAVTDEGTRNFDALLASDEPDPPTDYVTIASGHGLSRGMCLGRNSSTGEWEPVDDSAGDGTEVLRGVLAEDVDTTGGAKKAVVYREGTFAEEKVSFGGDDGVSNHREAAAEKGIYFKSIYEK